MSVPSVTLAELRIQVAIELMDGLIVTATVDGSESTLIDDNTLVDSPDAYRGSHAIVITAANAANVGQVRRVEASSPLTSSLTLAANLPAATVTGDVVHLVNLGGKGFRPQFYDQAIKGAISAAYPDAVEEAVSATSGPFDAEPGTIAIPEPLCAVFAIELLESDGDDEVMWRTIPKARNPGRWGSGWSLDRANQVLRVDGAWRDTADGLTYRVRGYQPPTVPTADDDPITLDLTWLKIETKAQLAVRRSADRVWSQWAVEWGRDSRSERGRIMTPREPGVEWL